MGDVLEFRNITGIICPACDLRMVFDKHRNEIRCTTPNCGEGFLRSSQNIYITHENGQTIISTEPPPNKKKS